MLSKLFIKNHQDIDNPTVRSSYGIMCGVIGIISNFIICILKICLGIITNAISIIADGINNLTDMLSSIITLIGFKISKKAPTKNHPFGHERAEYISGLIISLVIIGIGLILIQSSITKFIKFETLKIDPKILVITLISLVVTIILKVFQSLVYRKYGRKIASTTLLAQSFDSLSDCIQTIAIVICLVISKFYPNSFLDGIIGILLGIYIVYNGLILVKKTISPLIGEACSSEFINMVSEKIRSYEGVLGMHDLIIHSYGAKKKFLTAHVEVDSKVDINISHDIIDNIERDFLSEFGVNLVIHMDPIDIYDDDCLYLRSQITLILEKIDPVFTFHDFRIVKGQTHTNIIFDLVIPLNYKLSNEAIQKRIDLELNKLNYHNAIFAVITYDYDLNGGNL